MHEDEALDRRLDAALANYGDPGADSGIERRILARVQAERAPAPGLRWLPWAAVVAAAACLLIAVFLGRWKTNVQPSSQNQALRSAVLARGARNPETPSSWAPGKRDSRAKARSDFALPASIAHSGPVAAAQPIAADHATASAGLPKLDVFPSPRPPTPEERALADVAVLTPAPELRALAAAQTTPEPLPTFATVHIPPLDPLDEGGD